MANANRKSENAKSGTLTPGNSLTNSGTTMVSSALAQVMAIDSTQHYPITLDPLGTGNGPEVAWITAHTAASTGATIVRGREGTSGVAHTSTTAWVHGPTVADFIMKGTTAERAALTGGLPFEGQRWWDYDLDAELIYNGTAWYCVTPQTATVATNETTSSTSFVDLSTLGPAVTVTTGTKALVTLATSMGNNTDANGAFMGFVVSGATTLAASNDRSVEISSVYGSGQNAALSNVIYVAGLTAGINVFTAKYRANTGGTAFFVNRVISVVGLP